MSYTPSQHAGGEGNVTIGGTDMFVDGWSGGETAVLKDATTTGDYNPTAKVTRGRDKATKTRYEATLKAFIDDNNYHIDTMRAGTEVTNVVLNMTGVHKITIPLAIIKGVPIDMGGVEGLQTYQLQIASQGDYTVA